MDWFGFGRYDIPLAKDVGIRNAYARMVGARTGSVTEAEFKAVLDRYAPWQGLAAMYIVATGWRSGARYQSGHALRRQLKTDTTPCPTAAAVAAASSCPRSASGCGTASATTRRCRTSARSSAARSIWASPTSTSPTTTARRYGSAELNFGRILREDLRPYRDELIISTKAGYDMWPGPYGEWGSRKYLLSSLDQSLERMGLEYVDIFYSHRYDPDTPLEETIGALDTAVRSGRALYAGISSYSPERTREAHDIARALGTPLLIHQPSYSMINRWIEPELVDTCGELGMGIIAFSPLAQGMLTDRYLEGIPADSRAAKDFYLKKDFISEDNMKRIHALNDLAATRGQKLAQMALAWVLRDERVTSALIGASSVKQLETNVAALDNLAFTDEELAQIDQHAGEAGINIWEESSSS